MRLTYIHIQNFKSIRDMEIRDIDRALILVGKNNTGKTSVLDAVCAALGCYEVQEQDFNEQGQAVRIAVRLELSGEDLVVWIASSSPILLVLAIAAILLWRAGRLIGRLTGRRKKETGGRGPWAFGGKKKAVGEETPGEPENKGESREEKP